MIKYHPLQANTSVGATLFIDTEAGASDLLETAAHRIKAARDLLNSVSCLCLKNAEGYDLEHFANAAHLLLQDGCDALEVLGWSIDGCDFQTAPASDSAAPQTDFPV
ncbi:hypothetical protein [Pseudomonas ogarae]|uniref:DUF3077 domain-containing protein n=1 Tax=Pseudomonas ogarae (strain DSM 112162 / CECT 30235 / F113) TaxID=1114970 RepID=A0ABM6R7W2_PSEO1|nr:hypothetical protein [Pseudomonas ogarae]AEV65821.1 Hypothetical protein PSF113_5847 [Pseudomonas ogarae]AUO49592.1 hypothetical protein C1C98_31190 [Pseudomonas ogarae]